MFALVVISLYCLFKEWTVTFLIVKKEEQKKKGKNERGDLKRVIYDPTSRKKGVVEGDHCISASGPLISTNENFHALAY